MLSCAECDVELGRSGAMYCSSRCKDRARRVPCQFCGELKHTNAEGRKSGFTTCHGCIKDRAPHNASRYNRRGCRCDVCKADKAREMREYTQRNDYWNRPEVVAARKARRSTPEAVAKNAARWAAYYATESGKAAVRVSGVRRTALLRGATVEPISAAQMLEHLAQFSDCYLCGVELSGKVHIDHVHPLKHGGLHTLENLMPVHAACNLAKGDKLVVGVGGGGCG